MIAQPGAVATQNLDTFSKPRSVTPHRGEKVWWSAQCTVHTYVHERGREAY